MCNKNQTNLTNGAIKLCKIEDDTRDDDAPRCARHYYFCYMYVTFLVTVRIRCIT